MSEQTERQASDFGQVRSRYRRFAESEARDISPLYEALALAVAASDTLLGFVASLPIEKQQPNLVFAAVRRLYGTPSEPEHFAQLIERHEQPIRDLILARSTQTNEPGRCATLLPALSRLPQPLALLEIGASAGLCLLPDHWGYDYGRTRIEPRWRDAPIFPCHANAATPLPEQLPEVAWRAGIDLNPIDLSDPEEVAWLETLVWPGQETRAARLRAAIRVAQDNPPPLIKGDLLANLDALASTAPRDATPVVFHSAVLAYVPRDVRERFAKVVSNLDAVWISNEAPQVLPEIAAKLRVTPPQNKFLLAVNGEPVAVTGPHGQSIDWLA